MDTLVVNCCNNFFFYISNLYLNRINYSYLFLWDEYNNLTIVAYIIEVNDYLVIKIK